jgi:hypothetical protein
MHLHPRSFRAIAFQDAQREGVLDLLLDDALEGAGAVDGGVVLLGDGDTVAGVNGVDSRFGQ